jgi:ubiquinone/menaquinone biosynthesis C-methylase UbiE
VTDDLDQLMRAAYARIADEYARINCGPMPGDLLAAAALMAERAGPGGSIVDIGCGPGRDMAWFESRGVRVTGIDLSPEMLAHARRAASGPLLAMDMRSLAFRDSSFDGAWWCASLLHLPKRDAPAAIREARRVLRPGATLMLSVQQGSGEGWEERLCPDDTRFYARYQPGEMSSLLAGYGFDVEQESSARGAGRDWLSFLCVSR